MESSNDILSGKLVVFDVNGMIVSKNGVIRPGIVELVSTLKSRGCKVAVYSSGFAKNVHITLKRVFGDHRKVFSFILDRSHTQIDKDSPLSYATLKSLDFVFNNPFVNPDRTYDYTNTLLLEHDFLKTRNVSNINVLLISEFTGGDVSSNEVFIEMLSEKFSRFL